QLIELVHRAVGAAGDRDDLGARSVLPDRQVGGGDVNVGVAVDRQGRAVGALGQQVVHRQRLDAGQDLVVGRNAVEAESVADDALHAVKHCWRCSRLKVAVETGPPMTTAASTA